jgi:uncharacterized protein (TIGR02266 family)
MPAHFADDSPRASTEHLRTDRRFDRSVPIEFTYEGHTQTARTRNMSLGGVFIETDTRLPYGARIQMRFRVSTQVEAIEVGGQVRWCESSDEGEGVGLRFDGLRAREVWALNRYFAAENQ